MNGKLEGKFHKIVVSGVEVVVGPVVSLDDKTSEVNIATSGDPFPAELQDSVLILGDKEAQAKGGSHSSYSSVSFTHEGQNYTSMSGVGGVAIAGMNIHVGDMCYFPGDVTFANGKRITAPSCSSFSSSSSGPKKKKKKKTKNKLEEEKEEEKEKLREKHCTWKITFFGKELGFLSMVTMIGGNLSFEDASVLNEKLIIESSGAGVTNLPAHTLFENLHADLSGNSRLYVDKCMIKSCTLDCDGNSRVDLKESWIKNCDADTSGKSEITGGFCTGTLSADASGESQILMSRSSKCYLEKDASDEARIFCSATLEISKPKLKTKEICFLPSPFACSGTSMEETETEKEKETGTAKVKEEMDSDSDPSWSLKNPSGVKKNPSGEPYMCRICLTSIAAVVSVDCGHKLFCLDCVADFQKKTRENDRRCTRCQKPLKNLLVTA